MNDEIIIDVGIDCTRTALLEDGELAEIYIERPNQQAIVGNIYMGKIKSILKGMQAAFIDIGTEKNAFLFLGYKMEETRKNAGGGNSNSSSSNSSRSGSGSGGVATGSGSSHVGSNSSSLAGSGVGGDLSNNSDTDVVHGSGGSSSDDYDDMPSDINRRTFDPGSLREGGQIMVQVRKESYGTKGPRVSTDITLPGRYTVLLPEIEYAGVSRRIEKGEERDRLKKIIAAYKPAGMGVIARTAAEGINIREIARDIRFLAGIWKK